MVEYVLLGFFTLECSLFLIAMGPRAYFSDPTQLFSLFIVIGGVVGYGIDSEKVRGRMHARPFTLSPRRALQPRWAAPIAATLPRPSAEPQPPAQQPARAICLGPRGTPGLGRHPRPPRLCSPPPRLRAQLASPLASPLLQRASALSPLTPSPLIHSPPSHPHPTPPAPSPGA